MTMNDRLRPDIVISDRNRNTIAIVEVKAGPSSAHEPKGLEQLRHYVAALGNPETFAILADPRYIRIYHGIPSAETQLVLLPAGEILRHYDAEYDARPIYEPYLTSLVEAWLNDLSIHWQSEHPPGEKDVPEELVTRLQAA
jgi:hypothetical protein